MGINSQEVAYGFGQMGDILHTAGDNPITQSPLNVVGSEEHAARGGVLVAITFLEDSVFENDGLVAEDNTYWINDTTGSTSIDLNGGIVTDSVVFPAGITIYGRWIKVDLNSGKLIAYVGY